MYDREVDDSNQASLREERLAVYTNKAQAGLPLFDEAPDREVRNKSRTTRTVV
jgi:hypothetical protein